MTKPIPDGQKCIICKKEANGGIIKHVKGCPDYVESAKVGVRANRTR